MTEKNKSNEIKLIRIYDAPVKAVWDAWTDLKQIAQWWGPRGFTLTSHNKDLRPGGTWHYTMHGPDGTDYENFATYFEVEKCSRLVYDHGATSDKPALFRVTVTFQETNGKTKMEMIMALPTPEAAIETRKFIKKAGGDATWDRLGEFLTKQLSDKENFIINRTFSAPIQKMFDMWTKPEHFSKWLAPTGFTMKFIEANICQGGSTSYSMTADDGSSTMYGRASYLEITPVTRVVYTQQFCDAKGNISRHPKAPTWPETMLTTVTFSEEDNNHTRVTVIWEPHGKFTREELEIFVKAKGGMTIGWTGSFDKLETCLERT
jgi:uncharacterized protein YndB with AHSA1/START domain